MTKQLIEQDKETGFTFERVYKGTAKHRRIVNDPAGYEKAKRNAKSDNAWRSVVEWYQGREFKVSDHEIEVRKQFSALRNSTKPDGSTYRYCDIADIAGCDRSTVSIVMNGHNQLSKELADEILKNLEAHRQNRLE